MSTSTPQVASIESEDQLEQLLTRPSPTLVHFIRSLPSPLLILGAGGKMGPTLALLARRAADLAGHQLDIIAVSRFSDPGARHWLEDRGVSTIACDLLNPDALRTLPDAPQLLYLVGLKFGTARNPAATWAANTLVPSHVARRFPASRIVALSTGNVYPLAPVHNGGSVESDNLTPLGEYANAAVARERILEFHSREHQTPITLLRLFYAVELRYGVLVDIAQKIADDKPIDLANGHFNCIWQGDANDMVIRSLSLAASPPSAWNLCRPEIFSVRTIANQLGELLGKSPRFNGTEAPTALLGNSTPLCEKLGAPAMAISTLLGWIARWIQRGGRNLGRPTHFEVRHGNY